MNVMKRAWEIAKEAVIKFGGTSKEYFALALKTAWAEAKMYAGKFLAFEPKQKGLKSISTIPAVTTGSEKQINWANNIRAQFNNDIFNFLMSAKSQNRLNAKFFSEFIEFARGLFINKTDAVFWIDNRNVGIQSLVGAYRKEVIA